MRHAERTDTGPSGKASGAMGTDPDLSAIGQARAKSLATLLKDTTLTAIYTTEFKRTQQTAAPIAQAQGLTASTIPSAKTPDLIAKLKAATGAVLVVGHSNTITDVLTGLGITPPLTVAESEFDNLFIVVTGPQPRLVRLHYK